MSFFLLNSQLLLFCTINSAKIKLNVDYCQELQYQASFAAEIDFCCESNSLK